MLDAGSMAFEAKASPVGASKVLAIDPAHTRLVIFDEGRVKIATWHETRDPARKTVRYWQTREDLPVVREARRIPVVSFSPDGKRIATTRYGGFTLWGLKGEHFRQLAEFYGHMGTVKQLAFSRDGMQLATAGEDRTIRIWDVDPDHEL